MGSALARRALHRLNASDTGQVTVPQSETSKLVLGKGQAELTRMRYQLRTLSNGQQLLTLGITRFYYNASIGAVP